MNGPPDLGVLMDHYLDHQAAFRDQERTKRKTQDGTDTGREIYASGLGYCLRRQYLQMVGVPRKDTIDAKTRRTFAWGDHVENFARTVYTRLGLVVPPKNPRMVFGSLVARGDILLRFPPESVDEIPEDVLAKWSPEWVEFIRKVRSALPTDYEGYVWSEIKSKKSTAMSWVLKRNEADFSHRMQVGASMFIAAQDPSQLPVPDPFWQI